MNHKLIEGFKKIDVSGFPDFYNLSRSLERALWVLLVAKNNLSKKELSANQIAIIITQVMSVSVKSRSIANSLNRVKKGLVHSVKRNDVLCFQIMRAGEDHLKSQDSEDYVKAFYFEPGKKHSSKSVLKNILLEDMLNFPHDELKIVDPYCGERTLDVLKSIKGKKIKFLTSLANLRENKRESFLRELDKFQQENPNVEFRDYPHDHLHDRYLVSSKTLIILGCSINGLGNKESITLILNKNMNKDIFDALSRTFNERWKISEPL